MTDILFLITKEPFLKMYCKCDYGWTYMASPDESLDGIHVSNFLDGIRLSKLPHADVAEGFKSTLWAQLGNISE
jgi:hypothetical protein